MSREASDHVLGELTHRRAQTDAFLMERHSGHLGRLVTVVVMPRSR